MCCFRRCGLLVLCAVLPAASHAGVSGRDSLGLASCTIRGIFVEDDPVFDDEVEWYGSGCVLDRSGDTMIVITNRHVVGIDGIVSGQDEILSDELNLIRYAMGVEYVSGGFVYADLIALHRVHDIALLILVDNGAREGCDYVSVLLNRDGDYHIGDDVWAVGSGYGMQGSVTRGVISAFRELPAIGDSEATTSYIQIDAAINPGSSGGPLLVEREEGFELIGINTRKNMRADGIGFAIDMGQILGDLSDPDSWYLYENNPAGAAHAIKTTYGIPVRGVRSSGHD